MLTTLTTGAMELLRGTSDASLLAPGALRGREDLLTAAVEAAGKLAVASGSEATREAFVGDGGAVRALLGGHGVELVPVAAIVGGVLGSEAVKVLTGKDEPLGNTLLFEPMTTGAAAAKL
jgi:hypothetical protein